MKKTLSVLVVLMVISSVVFARRMDDPGSAPGVAIVKSGTTYKLYYRGSEQSNVKISIIDASNKVVFTEVIRHVDGFVRPYNFANLELGDYTIQVSDKNSMHSEKIAIQSESNERLAHLFKVKGEEGKFLLTVPNKVANDITVKIFDESNNIIYDQVEAVSSDFAKIYNLKKYTGKLTFQITDANGKSKSISY